MRALAGGMLLVASLSIACEESTTDVGGPPLPAPTFECAGAESSPIQCTTGELCVVMRYHPNGGYHFDEELKCTAMPAECLDEYADNWGWCDCLAYASCPWCDWDGFATVEDCTDQSIVVDWEEEALPPI